MFQMRFFYSYLWLPFTLALRDMRSGLGGFAVFIACLVLGVGSIAGISSVSRSLTTGLSEQGRVVLGGDLSFGILQRDIEPDELAFLQQKGRVVSVLTMRAMVAKADQSSALVELKAIDDAYPALGEFKTEPDDKELLKENQGVFGLFVDAVLLARLDMKIGDRVSLGEQTFDIRGLVVKEPDSLASGVGLGPRVVLLKEALAKTGLLQPGALKKWSFRLVLPDGTPDDAVLQLYSDVQNQFPAAGWEVKNRTNADARFGRNVERFTQFLTLIGLTSLLVGGIGIANSASAFLNRKTETLAVYKTLGATGAQVFMILWVEIMLVAAFAITIGLLIGGMLLFVLVFLFGDLFPIAVSPAVSHSDLVIAACYGFLTATSFVILPLARARTVPVTGLFRDFFSKASARIMPVYRLVFGINLLLLIGLAIFSAYDRRIALYFLIASGLSFFLLRGIALLMMLIAKKLPHSRFASLRIAVANLYRANAVTPAFVMALGLGTTLLVCLSLVESNLNTQLTRTLPNKAPHFFFLDIPNQDMGRFEAFMKEKSPGDTFLHVPMMRGRIVAIKGVPVAQIKVRDEISWVLDGDRGITYSASLPEGSSLLQGEWWGEDYKGPPVISMANDVAKGLNVGIGDELVVNVLGRNITARIMNLRQVDWRTIGINFVMVFPPSTFSGAPHTHLATLSFGQSGKGLDVMGLAQKEALILRQTAVAFPTITSLKVKDALEAINDVVAQLIGALRGTSSIALIASVLVLAGAMAAGHQARLYDAVVLKTLGATRLRLIGIYTLEYGLIAFVTAGFGLVFGALAAYAVVTFVMNFEFAFHAREAVFSALLAVIIAIGMGLLGTWRILGQKPARYLRSL